MGTFIDEITGFDIQRQVRNIDATKTLLKPQYRLQKRKQNHHLISNLPNQFSSTILQDQQSHRCYCITLHMFVCRAAATTHTISRRSYSGREAREQWQRIPKYGIGTDRAIQVKGSCLKKCNSKTNLGTYVSEFHTFRITVLIEINCFFKFQSYGRVR